MSKQTFDFSEALRRMKEGKKVTKRTLNGDDNKDSLYFAMNNNNEIISVQKHIVNDFYTKDILATDWEEVE